MRTDFRTIVTALSLCLLGSIGEIRADVETDSITVPVKIYVDISGLGNFGDYDPWSNSIDGTFVPSSPTATDGTLHIEAHGSGGNSAEGYSGCIGAPKVMPYHEYSLSFSSLSANVGTGSPSGTFTLIPPPGYKIQIGEMDTNKYSFAADSDENPLTYSTSFSFRVVPNAPPVATSAGTASSLGLGKLEWHVSLGAAKDGKSVGELILTNPGWGDSWSSLFTPEALTVALNSTDASTYGYYLGHLQVYANGAVIDAVPLTSGYAIRFYNPNQMQGSSYPKTFTGEPFVTYTVAPGSTDTSITITKEVRNITDTTTTGVSVARREVTTLTRSGSWPQFTWTLSDWTLDGQSALVQRTMTGGGTESSRTESIAVSVPGGSTALSVSRTYALNAWAESLVSETDGTSNGVTTTCEYYDDSTQTGCYGYLKKKTLSDGSWEAYDYMHPSGVGSGMIQHRYRPFLSSPSTATLDSSQGEVTTFSYTNDAFGFEVRPTEILTTVNGTTVGHTTIAYADTTANSLNVVQATRTDYVNSSNTLQTITKYYREDIEDEFFRSQVHSIQRPDGVKQSFAYQRGSWDGSSFTLSSNNGLASGAGSRITVITGTASGSTSVSLVDGYAVDAVYLVDNKSTKEVTIRDDRALVRRTETYAWASSGWQRVSYVDYSYDLSGQLVSRVASNGATYSATYDGGFKTSETSETGVSLSYTYDAAGRVDTVTRAAASGISALTTKYYYNAMGQVVQQVSGYGQSEALSTSRSFDDSGRLTSETPPGLSATTHSYDVANRVHTVTRPDGSTLAVTDFFAVVGIDVNEVVGFRGDLPGYRPQWFPGRS